MNKSFLFFVFVSLGFFLSACSGDDGKELTREELCANGPSKGCLEGRWQLEDITTNAITRECTGILTFTKEVYSFKGNCDFDINNPANTYGVGGAWAVNQDRIELRCNDCDDFVRNGTVQIQNSGQTLLMTSATPRGDAIVSLYNSNSMRYPTEKFSYLGPP
ncbi:MAG: hypothetical protein LBC85_12210 [Fibromonadaceae bacterium]|jgi:hypothetical protein|nr:hypothetical protein [Fibromonadaceae bacterium]